MLFRGRNPPLDYVPTIDHLLLDEDRQKSAVVKITCTVVLFFGAGSIRPDALQSN